MKVREFVFHCGLATIHRVLSGLHEALKSEEVVFCTMPVQWFALGYGAMRAEWCSLIWRMLKTLGGEELTFGNYNYDDRHQIKMLIFTRESFDMGRGDILLRRVRADGIGDMDILKEGEAGADLKG